jgi:hypothetical protein
MSIASAYILLCKRKIFMNIRMSSVISSHFQSTCRPLCYIPTHLIYNIIEHTHTKILANTLMMKLLIISVTQHMSANRGSDNIKHVTPNTINIVVVPLTPCHKYYRVVTSLEKLSVYGLT